MKKILLLLSTVSLIGMPVKAWDYEGIQNCEDAVVQMEYKEQYEMGKFHSEMFQEALYSKGWNEEQKKFYIDLSRYTSQHGDNGMTTKAQLLIGMYFAKRQNKKFDLKATFNQCLIGQFRIYSKRAWSPVHSGFTDHLSPQLKTLYFSLPSQ